MNKKIRNNKGFAIADVAVAVVILLIGISLLATIIYNTYGQIVATNNNALATYYAVEVIEKINSIDYNDETLNGNTITTNDGEILGINIDDKFDVTVNVTKYNTTEGNENKEDIIKIIEVIVEYLDFNVEKTLAIKSLKLV